MFGPTFIGALYGFGVKVGMNALRKKPYLREPYVHVMFMGIGAATANYVVDKNEENKQDIAEVLAYLEKPAVVRK